MAAETAAIQQDGGDFHVLEVFGGCRVSLTASRQDGLRGRSPSRGRFRLTQYGFSTFERSVTTFAKANSVTAFHRLVLSLVYVCSDVSFAFGECVISLPLVASLPPSIFYCLLPIAYCLISSCVIYEKLLH